MVKALTEDERTIVQEIAQSVHADPTKNVDVKRVVEDLSRRFTRDRVVGVVMNCMASGSLRAEAIKALGID